MAQVQLNIHNVFLADILLRKFAELDQMISGGLAGVFHYSGSVNSYDDLPEEGMKIGDTYNIVTADSAKNIAAGDNLAWNGTSWDNLRGINDLSAYYTSAQVDSKLAKYLLLTGGALTGAVTVQAPSENMHPATKQYVDTAVSAKANTSHTHVMADITDLAAKITEI